MDILVNTLKYEIIGSGIVFLEEDFLDFIIDGLVFRLIISKGPKEGYEKQSPFVNSKTEIIKGEVVMVIRAYNWGGSNTITLNKPIHLANFKGKRLFFRFSSTEIKGENDSLNFSINYSWYLEK